MTAREPLVLAETSLRRASGLPVAKCASSFARRAADWFAIAADYYVAAALYEQLSKQSDAELRVRGLSRATLARDIIFQARDRQHLKSPDRRMRL